MARIYFSIATISLALLVGISLSGCSETAKDQSAPASDHDEGENGEHDGTNTGGDHDGPVDFASGVESLDGLYQSIKAAFDEGDADKAHGPLHNVGDVLESLPELMKKAELSADDAKTANEAVDQMFDAYGVIDTALHKGEEADYASVATTLDENMAVLKEIAEKTKQ